MNQLGKIKIYFLLAVIVLVTGVLTLFKTQTVSGYTAYGSLFAVNNSAGTEIFRIEDIGRMAGGGGANLAGCDANSGSLPAANKPGNWATGWEVRDANGDIIFYVEQSGNNSIVHLDGSINQNQGAFNPGNEGNLIFNNKDGEIFAYISDTGNLYLKEAARCP
ncbi:MAG: hypothetical protein Q8P32_05075 [Candidatus Komeilibacteria bacterium]|nr:hypothetical protein [Candidatus Komeilibacteria bacterium]